MQVNAILGVDISKKKFDVCQWTVKNDTKSFKIIKMVLQNLQFGAMAMEQILLIYVLSWYGEDLATFMHDLGHNVSILNPESFWQK